jgi:hypothetical protein
METIIPFLFSFSLPSLTTPQLPPNTMQVRKTRRGVKIDWGEDLTTGREARAPTVGCSSRERKGGGTCLGEEKMNRGGAGLGRERKEHSF